MYQYSKWLIQIYSARLQVSITQTVVGISIFFLLTMLVLEKEYLVYQKSIIQSQINTHLTLKQNTVIDYALTGEWPKTQLDSKESKLPKLKLSHVSTENGHFTRHFNPSTLAISYRLVTGNYPNVILRWACGYQSLRPDETTNTNNQTTIDQQLLSEHCRRITP